MALNHRQMLFCQEYIVDLNATQAAIRAGYSEDTAYSIGHENLNKPEIAEAVQKAMDLRAERTGITADRVLVELAKIGFADIREIFTPAGQLKDVAALSDGIAGAVQSVKVVTRSGDTDDDGNREVEYVHEIKLADKKGSLELMGKHLRLFSDKVEVSGPNGKPIEGNLNISFKPVSRA